MVSYARSTRGLGSPSVGRAQWEAVGPHYLAGKEKLTSELERSIYAVLSSHSKIL